MSKDSVNFKVNETSLIIRMWLRFLHISFEACYYLLSLLLCQNSIYAQNLCMLYDLIAFKPYVCFDFQNLSIYDHYMYYYWPIRQII
jgi:hypothetical protein